MKILSIDPGPTSSGFVYSEGLSIIDFGKEKNKIIRQKGFNPLLVLIESPDYLVKNAGLSMISTAIEIGRFIELYEPKCFVEQIGRKEVLSYFKLKNDKSVRDYLIKKYDVSLTKDSWQAYLLTVYKQTRFNLQ